MKDIKLLINILLAEDDIDDRIFFKRALNLVPIATKLTIVNDGEQLMEYLMDNLENLPDILFLDISMPRKTGIECLEEIQENKLLRNVPIAMLSTSYLKEIDYEKGIKEMLLKMGANEFIRKSEDIEGLKDAIENSIKRLIL